MSPKKPKQQFSYAQIKEAFETIFPDKEKRHVFLEIFSQSISYINQFENGQRYWCTGFDNYAKRGFHVYFHIGSNKLVMFDMYLEDKKGHIWLSIDDELNETIQLEDNVNWQWDQDFYPHYSSIKARNGYYLCPDLSYWNEVIKPLYLRTIENAHTKYKRLNGSSLHKHNANLVQYINDQLGLNLAQPCYDDIPAANSKSKPKKVKADKPSKKHKQKVGFAKIKQAFKRALPDEEKRKNTLKILFDSISYINNLPNGQRYWCIGCANDVNYIKFIVGNNILLALHLDPEEAKPPAIWLAIDKAAMEESTLLLEDNTNWEWSPDEYEFAEYSSINSRNGSYSCADFSYWETNIKPLYFRAIDAAHKKYTKLNSKSRNTHNANLVHYIREELGYSLEDPCDKPVSNSQYTDNTDELIILPEKKQRYQEGAVKKSSVNRYERDDTARQACIDHYGAVCQACGMDFHKQYGDLGKGFIHVHHITPLHTIQESYEVDPIKDLVPVCPNCHAMIHRIKDTTLSVDELKQRIQVNNETND